MKAEELTGKRALRITETPNTDLPFSLTKVPVLIEKATETHIVCRIDNTQTQLTIPQSEPIQPKKSVAKRILFCFIPQFLTPKPTQAQKPEAALPDTPFLLDQQYCDDNWIDFDELIAGTSLENSGSPKKSHSAEYGFLFSPYNIVFLILLGFSSNFLLFNYLNISAELAMNIGVIFSVLVFGGEMFFVMVKQRKQKIMKGKEIDEQK